MKISNIPINELLDDRAASELDIVMCKVAKTHDIKEYNGHSVEKRLTVNQKIIDAIDKELAKRAETV